MREVLELTATQFIRPMSTGRNHPWLLGKEKLGALTEKQIKGYFDAVPAEWLADSDFGEKIAAYLREARQHRDGLVNFVKHILR